MIFTRQVVSTICRDIEMIINDPQVMVIDRKYVDSIPESELTLPRVIVDLIMARDSEYYYEEFVPVDDELQSKITRITKFIFKFYFISSSNDNFADTYADRIRSYYNNPKSWKLDGRAVVRYVSNLVDTNSWIKRNDLNIIELSVNFDIDNVDFFNLVGAVGPDTLPGGDILIPGGDAFVPNPDIILPNSWAEQAEGELDTYDGKPLTIDSDYTK